MKLSEITAAALLDDQRRLASISQNLANVKTAGYKGTIHLSPRFEYGVAVTGGLQPTLEAQTRTPAQAVYNGLVGALRPTGRAQDVVVEGGAYLLLMTPDGIAYARSAQLRIDAEGRLVNEAGYELQLQGGAVRLPPKTFSVRSGGEIVQDGEVVGRLAAVEPVQEGQIRALGNGAYTIDGEMRTAGMSTFQSGFAEASNVEASMEMTRLLETVRHFEALQKVVLAYGDMNEKAARRLGEF